MVATAATVGAGTVGGVFTPTMFVGAAAGRCWARRCINWAVAAGVPAGAFALVGMGAVLAATTRSPLLALIMIFELSLDYSLVPPLMLACVVSILVARQLHGESIYTEHLRVKGLASARKPADQGAAMEQTVGDLMHAPVSPVRENHAVAGNANRFPGQFKQFPARRRRPTAAARHGGIAGFERMLSAAPGYRGGHRL